MKIYIVTYGEYSDYSISAVFTDKVKAEAYTEIQNRGSRYMNYGIEEWDADQTLPFEVRSVRFYPELIRIGKGAGYAGEPRAERVEGTMVVQVMPETILNKVVGVDGTEMFMGVAYGLTYEAAEKSLWDHLAKAKAEAAGF